MVGKALERGNHDKVNMYNSQVGMTTPTHRPHYEDFFMNIAEEFVISGKVSMDILWLITLEVSENLSGNIL